MQRAVPSPEAEAASPVGCLLPVPGTRTMTIVADLFALQEIDSAIDAADRELESVRAQMGEDEAVLAARAAVAEQEARRRAAEARARDLETQITDLRAKAEPVERKLYGGSVRQPKELQDLNDEVEMYRRQQRAIEDRQLEVMEELESSAAGLAAARKAAAEVEGAWEMRQASLRARENEIQRHRAELVEQRGERARRIDAQRLALYERLRKARGGRAVARIERGICQGCRIALPTTLQQRARSGLQVVQCTSCDRILYAG